jgi:hypothetical protein
VSWIPCCGTTHRGGLFQSQLEKHLPARTFEQCKRQFGVTAFDLMRLRTTKVTRWVFCACTNCLVLCLVDTAALSCFHLGRWEWSSGELATAIRASCTFPLLFQPVWLEGSYHIDGGVFDDGGLMALPGVPASNTILNIGASAVVWFRAAKRLRD